MEAGRRKGPHFLAPFFYSFSLLGDFLRERKGKGRKRWGREGREGKGWEVEGWEEKRKERKGKEVNSFS